MSVIERARRRLEREEGKGNGSDEKEKTGGTTWQVEDRDQEAGGIRRFLSAAGEVDRIHSARIAEPGDRQQPARSVAIRRVFLRRVGRSENDSRRAGREIYIDTRVKTIVPLPIAAAGNDIDPGKEDRTPA